MFAQRGYRHPAWALADLLGMERAEARRRVIAAEQVGERVGLDGQLLPPRLPATAERFAAGEAGLRHVEVIAAVLGSDAARRLAPPVWAAAEAELAGKAGLYTPASCATTAARSWIGWTRTAPPPTPTARMNPARCRAASC